MINTIFFLGDVVKGPYKRTTHTGSTITTISLKQEKGENPDTGKKESVTVPVLFFAGLAEQVAIMVSKGMKIMVEGKLNIRYFIDKEKKAHQYTEIIGKHITPKTSPIMPPVIRLSTSL